MLICSIILFAGSACVSSLDVNASETLSTLEYANRARNIQNKTEASVENISGCDSPRSRSQQVLNRSSSEIEISLLQQEINHLKLELKDALTAKSALEKIAPTVRKVFVLKPSKSLDDSRLRLTKDALSRDLKSEDTRGVEVCAAISDTLSVPAVPIQALQSFAQCAQFDSSVENITIDKNHATIDEDRVHVMDEANSNKMTVIKNNCSQGSFKETQAEANGDSLHLNASLVTTCKLNGNVLVDESALAQSIEAITESKMSVVGAARQTFKKNSDGGEDNGVAGAEENQNESPHKCVESRPLPVLELSDCISVLSDVYSNEDLFKAIKMDAPKMGSPKGPEVDSPKVDKTPELSPAALQRSMHILHTADIFLSLNELVHSHSTIERESSAQNKETNNNAVRKSAEKDSDISADRASHGKVDLMKSGSAPKRDFTVKRSPCLSAGLRRCNAQSSPFRPMKLFPFEGQRSSPPNVTADLETLLQVRSDLPVCCWCVDILILNSY